MQSVTDNHKPDTPPSLAKVRQNISSKGTYDLTYQDGGIYKYRGERASEDGKFVLIFDPSRQAYVLHKVDSTFNVNLIHTPTNKDAESLRQEYPHLENSSIKVSSTKGSGSTSQTTRENKARKPDKDKSLTVPEARPSKPLPKKHDPESEEDDSDDDGGLVMEFPGGQAPGSNRDFSPAFPPRRFSDFTAQLDEEEDADGEDDDDDMSVEHFKLPSPMNFQTTSTPALTQQTTQAQAMPLDAESESEEDEEFVQVPTQAPQQGEEEQEMDLDVDDLEAELQAELQAELEANQSESDVSEED
jgi:hypothetical protein